MDGDGVADTLEFGGAAGPVGGGGDAGRTYDAWGGVSSANAAGGPAGARSLGGSGRRLAGAGGAAGGRGGGGGGGRRLADVAAGADGRRARFIGPSWHDLKLTPFSLQTMARTGACYLREVGGWGGGGIRGALSTAAQVDGFGAALGSSVAWYAVRL